MANNIEKQLKEISERLEQGVKEIFTSERYTEYLNTMSKFHNYSFNNTLLITMQKPEATLVAGYQAWQKKFNRHVKRGEKGIQIIAPAPIREKQEIEKIDPVTKEPVIGDDGQPETEIVEMVIPRFRVTTVFDVSQTEGEPIAELEVPELTGSVQFYDTFMQALQNISPVPIRMMNVEGDAKGYYHQTEKYIAIKEDMSNVQTMKTGVHEVSHALLHDREVMDAEGVLKDQTTKEVEAESIAYIVCNHFGLDTSEYSFTYIASWCESRDMKALKASMDTIRKTSAEIIENIEAQMYELEMERPIRDTFHKEDLILHLSGSMGSAFTYDLIENMSREQLEQNVGEFARNTLDTLKYVRMLRERNIAVYFEVEKINTLKDGEFLLTILSSVAQQEVENTSAYVKKGLKMLLVVCLNVDFAVRACQDEDGIVVQSIKKLFGSVSNLRNMENGFARIVKEFQNRLLRMLLLNPIECYVQIIRMY